MGISTGRSKFNIGDRVMVLVGTDTQGSTGTVVEVLTQSTGHQIVTITVDGQASWYTADYDGPELTHI